MGNTNIAFLVDKNDLFKTAFADESRPNSGKNEVILKIDKYAFTANNITYAVVGEKMGYWHFFPAEEPYGIVPVWGFADVVSSNYENISLDDRYYGYFPMSTYLKVDPKNVKPFGFVDGFVICPFSSAFSCSNLLTFCSSKEIYLAVTSSPSPSLTPSASLYWDCPSNGGS